MPRRNKHKTVVTESHKHAPTPFSKGYKPECGGCAFVGFGSVCLTSDGKCLKTPPLTVREVSDAENNRRTNKASAER